MFSLHLLLSKLRMDPFTMSEKDKVTVLIVDEHLLSSLRFLCLIISIVSSKASLLGLRGARL